MEWRRSLRRGSTFDMILQGASSMDFTEEYSCTAVVHPVQLINTHPLPSTAPLSSLPYLTHFMS